MRFVSPLALLIASLVSPPLAGAEINFNRDIRPLLSNRCFECHGPDEHERKAGLRLDLAQGEHGAYRTRKGRTAIQPGSVEESELWHRVVSENPDERMPPPESKKPALSEAERTLVNAWIEAGAPYDEFWAFVPPQAPASLPEASRPDWNRHPIDRLVHGHLQSKGLTPHPRADRPTLIRRVTFDLTGLPPLGTKSDLFSTMPSRRHTNGWWIASSIPATSASTSPSIGWTWSASPIPTASTTITIATSRRIATGSSAPSMPTCPTTTSFAFS